MLKITYILKPILICRSVFLCDDLKGSEELQSYFMLIQSAYICTYKLKTFLVCFLNRSCYIVPAGLKVAKIQAGFKLVISLCKYWDYRRRQPEPDLNLNILINTPLCFTRVMIAYNDIRKTNGSVFGTMPC